MSTETSTALPLAEENNVSYFDCMYFGGLDIEPTLKMSHVLKCQLRTWKMSKSIRYESIRSSQRGDDLFVNLLDNPDLTANLPFSNSDTHDPCSLLVVTLLVLNFIWTNSKVLTKKKSLAYCILILPHC